jgi:DNA damage-binding protein 2
MDVDASRSALLLGDDIGGVHVVDARCGGDASGSSIVAHFQAAKKGTKVVALGVANAGDPSLFVTAGNDHMARVWDARMCGLVPSGGAGAAAAAGGAKALSLALATLPHPRVVNAASFSPLTGRRLLTTCQDNRLRVWDVNSSSASLATGIPDRELVHSHDFNRYLTTFKAVWDPKDATENALVIGRYISEDVAGAALHPIDVLSASSGRLLAAMRDPNVTTICPVVVPHPRRDVLATGSSRNIYVYEPEAAEDDAEEARAAVDEARGGASDAARARGAIPRMLDLDDDAGKKKKARGGRDDDDDDGGGFGGGGKKKGKARA